MSVISPFIISFFLTLFLVPISRDIGLNLGFFDLPDSRKINHQPVVRIGGLAMYLSFLLGILSIFIFGKNFLENIDLNYLFNLVFFSLCFFLLGIADDIYSLSPKFRLIVQFIFASLTIYYCLDINQIYILYPGLAENILSTIPFLKFIFLMIWLVGVTNAINWIDGMDGLASGCSGIIALTFALIALRNGQYEASLIGICLTATCLGFLKYNFSPANIFMGDGGSYYLGFTLAYLSIISTSISSNQFNFNIALIVLSYPVLDMFFVILNRLKKKLPMIYPDRSHLHHRILRLGFKKTNTVLILYSITFITSLIGLSFVY